MACAGELDDLAQYHTSPNPVAAENRPHPGLLGSTSSRDNQCSPHMNNESKTSRKRADASKHTAMPSNA
jgi:hypothetical protein|tara:strand:- start:271 stop:477 length:207 start_codon:yes stop_codon:yes gene_type:complete